MKITFLGTGTSQGVPVITCECDVCRSKNPKDQRLRSSVLIEHQGKTFVIDTGPDFRQQMLREDVKHIDFVLLTHEHKDHTAGLDDIRAFNHSQKENINIYANKRTCSAVRSEFAYAFCEDKYPGVPEINLCEINNKDFEAKNIHIQPLDIIHFKLPVLGFRIDRMAYITDANAIPEHEIPKLLDLDLLIINALGNKHHYSHFNLTEALEVVECIKPKQSFFTHISHVMGLHDQVNKNLPPYAQLAYDGLTIEL
ncbi:MAG: MBL fold metallo-hydrolase [Bacteroidales bacterium]|nr:MBL fold metallo-hydrolase [Bacteroidales bacterium]OQA88592.1 MAG: Phosphoribosyl 1,2-cyclic phosphodiesterase [Bacteroidetes bacterium ADurb.Bin234]